MEIQAEYKKGPNGVLENFDHVFAEHKIHGILGKSGCGKSTLLKLLMRFYETSEETSVMEKRMSVRFRLRHCAAAFPTSHRRHSCLRIRSKITSKLQKRMQAGKKLLQRQKAALHEFILSLPDGYDTKLAELGDSVSGGERQRIGIARAFLHDGDMIFLDEPTRNIDSLNEGIILRSLDREKENKTILLVSHRKSTMAIADDVVAM